MLTVYAPLAAAWILWCVLHSAFIARSVTRWVERHAGAWSRYYRLSYNIFSVLSFALVYFYQTSLPYHPLFRIPVLLYVVLTAGLLAGTAFLLAGARVYDNRRFLGLRQIAEDPDASPGETEFRRGGVLRFVRHPYYTGGLLILICFPSAATGSLVMRMVLIVYLYIGTMLEERKLLAEFGETYRAYMRDVPRFFPRLFRKMPNR